LILRGHVSSVAHLGAPDLDWPNPGLDGALRSMTLPHDAVATIRQWMRLSPEPAPAVTRSILRAKPAVVNGEERSLTKTTGDGLLSRCSRRRDRPPLWNGQEDPLADARHAS
jgi:hypothetical protein